MEKLTVHADYNQFYLMDLGLCPEIPEQVTDEDLANRFRSSEGIVVFHTEEAGQVAVFLSILSARPSAPATENHVVEISLSLPSGVMAVAGCTEALDSCAKIEIQPGQYRCRALYSKNQNGVASFTISLWPEPPAPPLVGNEVVAANEAVNKPVFQRPTDAFGQRVYLQPR